MYVCEVCKTSSKEEDDDFWFNIKEKDSSNLRTLCWSCAMKKCNMCLKDGIWYQKSSISGVLEN